MKTSYDLRQPCNNCPFRKGMGEKFQLHDARLTGIWMANGFQCHKTVDYSGDEDENGDIIQPVHNPKKQECAGFMTLRVREGDPTMAMRLLNQVGWLDFAELDPKREVYETWNEAFTAHQRYTVQQ